MTAICSWSDRGRARGASPTLRLAGTELHKLLKGARYCARRLAAMSAQLDRARERIRGRRPLAGLFRPGSAAVDAPVVKRCEERRARNEEASAIVRGMGGR